MKTYETTLIKGFNYTVDHADALPAGHGHKEITVTISSQQGEIKQFTAVTSNMVGYDNAADLEGQEKYEALFELVQPNLEDKITEWLYELDA